jgi:hypothetical protein
MGRWAEPPWTAADLRADAEAMRVAALCGVSRNGGLPLALSAAGAMKDDDCGWSEVLYALTHSSEQLEIAGEAYHPYQREYATLVRARTLVTLPPMV